jgi:hypothetical protein
VIDGQDGNGKFYIGIWFDECDVTVVPYVQTAGASQDVVRVNGSKPGESWFPNYVGEMRFGREKISAANPQDAANWPQAGVHVAGSVGGLSFDSVDILGDAHDVVIPDIGDVGAPFLVGPVAVKSCRASFAQPAKSAGCQWCA